PGARAPARSAHLGADGGGEVGCRAHPPDRGIPRARGGEAVPGAGSRRGAGGDGGHFGPDPPRPGCSPSVGRAGRRPARRDTFPHGGALLPRDAAGDGAGHGPDEPTPYPRRSHGPPDPGRPRVRPRSGRAEFTTSPGTCAATPLPPRGAPRLP